MVTSDRNTNTTKVMGDDSPQQQCLSTQGREDKQQGSVWGRTPKQLSQGPGASIRM